VRVQGTPIETLAWGRRGDPGLLLLHGNGAHADWYSFIGPLLKTGRRVVALSFSGAGGSGWRTQYSVAQWADEALAVAEATGLFSAAVPPVVQAWAERLRAVQAGHSSDRLLDVPLADASAPPFHRQVWAQARQLAPGQTCSYGDLARALGEPGAARAVGQALGANPFAPIVPCHRVLAARGGAGGFSAPGGAHSKLRLLALEGARFEWLPGQASLF